MVWPSDIPNLAASVTNPDRSEWAESFPKGCSLIGVRVPFLPEVAVVTIQLRDLDTCTSGSHCHLATRVLISDPRSINELRLCLRRCRGGTASFDAKSTRPPDVLSVIDCGALYFSNGRIDFGIDSSSRPLTAGSPGRCSSIQRAVRRSVSACRYAGCFPGRSALAANSNTMNNVASKPGTTGLISFLMRASQCCTSLRVVTCR